MAKKYIIKQNIADCIGCGICASLCDNWEMTTSGKAKPKKKEVTEIGCNKDAADSCPADCITITEK